jgi:transposase InsO family protein
METTYATHRIANRSKWSGLLRIAATRFSRRLLCRGGTALRAGHSREAQAWGPRTAAGKRAQRSTSPALAGPRKDVRRALQRARAVPTRLASGDRQKLSPSCSSETPHTSTITQRTRAADSLVLFDTNNTKAASSRGLANVSCGCFSAASQAPKRGLASVRPATSGMVLA